VLRYIRTAYIAALPNAKREAMPHAIIPAIEPKSDMFSRSPEEWKSLFEWISVGLLFLTFAAGYGIIHFGNRVDEEKSEQLRQFDKDLRDKDVKIEEAKRAAAEANERAEHEALERAKLETEFVKQGPRFTLLRTHRDEIIKAMRPLSGQRFTTLNEFVNTDTEALRTSSEITVILESEAKWLNNTPHGASGGFNMYGVGVIVRILPTASEKTQENAKRLFSALQEALLTGVQFADNGKEVKAALPPAFPFDEDTVLIEVGEHPVPISTPYTSRQKNAK
jgi:hypothetical protein